MKHFQVVGGPGSGKSTLSKKIAKKYDARIIELDALYWKPNWGESSKEEFVSKIEKAIGDAKKGWVIDGSYTGLVGHVIQPKLDFLVYLQVPLYVSVPRALRRSFLRILKGELLWGTNKETVFNSIKLGLMAIKSHKGRASRMHEIYKSNKAFEMYIFKSNKSANKWLDLQV